MKRDGQFLYRTSQQRIDDLKIQAIKEKRSVSEILDQLIDEHMKNNR